MATAVAQDFAQVAHELNEILRQIHVLKLGINLDSLARFENLVPRVRVGQNSGRVFLTRYGRAPDPAEDDARFALDFATDAVLRVRWVPVQSPPSSGRVRVKTETKLKVFPPHDGDPGENLMIAEIGDEFDRPRHPRDRDDYLQVFFEGEPAYLPAEAVEGVGTEQSAT